MSYDINFKAKLENVDAWVDVCETEANTTWNLRKMIEKSTGLEWKNEEDNGLVTEVIPYIRKGLDELEQHPEKYMKYESPNGWGTLNGCKYFFQRILDDYEDLKRMYPELVPVAHFWIE